MAKRKREAVNGKSGTDGNGAGGDNGQGTSAAGNGEGDNAGSLGPAVSPQDAAASSGAYSGGTGSGGTETGERTKRSYTKRGTAKAPLDLSITGTLLLTIHMMLAERTKIDELKLTQQEADMLAEKICAVQKTFDVEVSPRTKAVIELGICGATIYGSRVGSYVIRKRSERATVVNG